MNTETVLITGASSGIGYHLARQFAKHGHPLIIVAPVESELRDVAATLAQTYNVSVTPIATDLTSEEAVQSLIEQVNASGTAVEILVNNAGLGQLGKFWEIPLEKDLTMIQLNIAAVVRLTKAFLPPMLQRGHGRILNTASVAGFEPGPNLAVYHATKAFVLSFSEALATELQDTGVTLTALCPGPVDTDFMTKADMVGTRGFQKANLMAPQEVAETAFEALMKGDRVIVPGATNKVMVFGRRLMPGSAQAKMNETLYQEVDPEDRTRERGDMENKAAQEELAEKRS